MFRWDPTRRMTPDEACQHEWIREGMVHRSRAIGRTHSKRQMAGSIDSSAPDPYKTAAQPPMKGKQRNKVL